MSTDGPAPPRRTASIGARVRLCLVVIVVAVLTLTSVNLMVGRSVASGAVGTVDQARGEAIPLLQLAEAANEVAWTASQVTDEHPDPTELRGVVAETNARVANLDRHGFSNPAIREAFTAGVVEWREATALLDDARDARLTSEERSVLGQRLFPLIERASSEWNRAHERAMDHLADRLAEAEDQRADAIRLSAAVAFFVIAVALVIGLRLTRTVVRPTQALRAATARIAAGDHEPVVVGGPTELAELAADFNAMAAQLREREATLVHRALHDPLTGFGNRTMLADRLGQALRRRLRHPEEQVAVLVLDLDGFKNLNDSLGHAVGDEALRSVGARLEGCLREADTIARLGGDEFAVVLEGDDETAMGTAERLCACLREPVTIAGRSVRLTASVGVATTRWGDASSNDLLRDADLAMYAAKRRGGDTVDRFTRAMHVQAEERLQLEEDLRAGLGHGQLEVHYQPIIELATGNVAAVEALARWRHPQHGLLGPDRFIPLAELTGLIVPLGWEVIGQAVLDAASWPAGDGGLPALAVNLSPRQLDEPDVVDRLLSLLETAGLPAARLLVEITETTTLDQVVDASDELGRLRAAGARIALDDFGTGYTSLRYLHGTPVDVLKIDRAFIHGLADSRDQQSLVRTILELAEDMGYSVVAEGVEREEDLEVLAALSCPLVQGYALGRPVPAAELMADLAAIRTRRVTPAVV